MTKMNFNGKLGLTRAIKSITRGRIRSVLTIVGVAVGVFAVVVISGVGSVGTSEITATMATMGINSALVETTESGAELTLTDSDVSSFGQLNGVRKAMPLMASPTESRLLGENITCYAWGVDEDAKDIISIEPLHGRLISDSDVKTGGYVCVVDEQIALDSYGRSNIVGKKINLLLGGRYVEFEIVGIAKSGITTLQNIMSGIIPSFVYIPYSTMQDITGRGTFDKIALLLDEENASESLTQQLTDSVNSLKSVDTGLTISNFLSQKTQLTDILGTTTTVLSLIAGISLVVSGITVMTTMLVSVNERTREIGIKKSIGAKNSDILWEFLLESVLLTAFGSLCGIVTALALCMAGCALLGVSFTIPTAQIAVAFLFSVGMGAVFGAYPAVKAARLSPIDALRG